MSNSFYKPKNEFGDLLASEKYVQKSIDDLSSKHDKEIEEVAKDITALEDRPPFMIDYILDGSTIDEYIKTAWRACESEEEKAKLKVKIGRTLYLRKTGEGDTAQYEEYICTNPGNIHVEDETFTNGVEFNRLGAVEAIVATTSKLGSVRLEHSIYNNTSEEWNKYLVAETVGGEPTGEHLPVEALAVAPCALYDFFKADDKLRTDLATETSERKTEDTEIKGRLDNAEHAIKHIKEEILYIVESEEEGIQDSRLDMLESTNNTQDERLAVNEGNIKAIKDIIGMNGCCPECGEKECSCTCNNTDLDCTIICKLQNLQLAVDDNSEQISEVDNKIEKELRPAIIKNAENIAINAQNIQNNSTNIAANASDIKSINSEIDNIKEYNSTQDTNIATNAAEIIAAETRLNTIIGTRPDDGTYAETLWAQDTQAKEAIAVVNAEIQRIDKENEIHEVLSEDIAHINEIIGKRPEGAVDIWSKISTIDSLVANNAANIDNNSTQITNISNRVDKNITDIANVDAKLGDTTHEADINGNAYQRIRAINNALTEYKESNNAKIATIEGDINALSTSVDENIAIINENIGTLNTTVNNNITEIDRLKARSAYSNIVLECDLPVEDHTNGEGNHEATVAIPYCYISEVVEKTTGVYISPSNLSIVFNGARFTVEDGENTAEQIIPDVTYDGLVDVDNNTHRALVLTFAGLHEKARHMLVSLTYYDNEINYPHKVNIIRIK